MSKTAGSTQSGYSDSQTHGPVDGTIKGVGDIDGEYDSTISGPTVPGDFYGGSATLDRAKWC